MKDKLTVGMIRKAVKILRKNKIKLDKDVFVEVEPTIRTDFLWIMPKENKEMIIDKFKKKKGV